MIIELNSCEAMLKPRNKKQQKQLDNFIKHLDLKTKGEILVLNCVLYMDWNRQKILQSIDYLKDQILWILRGEGYKGVRDVKMKQAHKKVWYK